MLNLNKRGTMKAILLSLTMLLGAFSALAQCNSTDIFNNDTTTAVCFETVGRVLKCYSNNMPDHDDSYSSSFTLTADDDEYSMCAYPDTATNFTPLYEPVETVAGCTDTYTFGVSINGVKYDPSSAEYFENTSDASNNIEWHVEARYIFSANFGNNGGHLNPFGDYHYHDVPADYFKDSLGIDGSAHSPIVGYAADGFPIYYKYVYSDALDTLSVIEAFNSGYTLKSGTRPGDGVSAPDGSYTGLYYEDYEYNASELDSCNGRYGFTPDYPYGTYYYVLTDSYPYIPRCFKGDNVDNSYLVGPAASCASSDASTSCASKTAGCMDPFANNYNSSANVDNGTCTYNFQVIVADQDATCAGNDGLVNATVFGGTAPYTYTWSVAGSASSISDLTPGSYTVTVVDASSSETQATATVGEANRLLDTSTGDDEKSGSGYALSLDGTDDYVDFEGDMQLTSHSFSAWVNTSATTSQTLMQLALDGNNYVKVALNATGRVTATISESSSASKATRSSGSINDGEWHHVAYTFDATGTGTLHLYIDGTRDNGTAVSNDNLTFSISASDLHIGANRGGTSTFNGTVDEVLFWSTALTAPILRSNMCKKITNSYADNCDLYLYLRFDENTGSTVNDWIGGNNGTFESSPTYTSSGAPVGDDAQVATTVSASSNVMLASATGDNMTATVTSGTADLLVIYRVDEAPNVTTAPGAFVQLSESSYYGVKLLGSSSGVYSVTYDYNGHPGISDESTLGIASRSSNAAVSWTEETLANLNQGANTVKLDGQTGTEFILASKGGNTLPVELLEFTASVADNETVRIDWSTASEWNNDYFTVERSADNSTWTTVDMVSAKNEGAAGANYSIKDYRPADTRCYYRLKQTDVDGTSTVSKTVAVEFQRTVNMRLYPNPASSFITVSVADAELQSIELIDIHGRMVLQAARTHQLDISSLPSGVYLLRANGANGPLAWENIVKR